MAFLLFAAWASSSVSETLETDEPELARIVTGDEIAMQCIAPVHVTRVDGEPRQLPRRGFDLEPGVHSLHGTARINVSYCRVRQESQPNSIPALEFSFEAGNTYYVGLDHSPEKREDWRLVVWKVESAVELE